MAQGCRQAHLAASEHIKQRLFGLQSGCGSWQAGDMASNAKPKKNPAAVVAYSAQARALRVEGGRQN